MQRATDMKLADTIN